MVAILVNDNSTTANFYDFTDVTPIKGTGFYRLAQKDKDGKISYSGIVRVNNANSLLNLISLYPNPASDKLYAIINVAGTSQMATISILDITGKKLRSFKQQIPAGYSNVEIDVAKHTGATYLLSIEMPSGEKLLHRFVKK